MEIIEGFVKFWRVLLRFFLGFLFVFINILNLFCDLIISHINSNYQSIITNSDSNFIENIAFIFIFFFTIGATSVFGLLILEIITENITFLLHLTLKGRFYEFIFRHNFTSKLILPIPVLAKKIFDINSQDILRYCYLKSWCRVEEVKYFEILERHIGIIYQHMKLIKEIELIQHIDYYGSVTQEQAKRDHLRSEILDIYYFMIVIFSTLILVCNQKLLLIFDAILVFLILVILFFPVIINRRLGLAIYVLIGYLDNFTIGQGASVEDREAI